MEGFPTSSSVWQRTAAWREEAPHLHVQSGLGLPEVTRFHLLLASLEPDWLLAVSYTHLTLPTKLSV